jgi:hypothetical protein
MRQSLEKPDVEVERTERVGVHPTDSIAFDDQDEPIVHFRTWIALISMGVLQFVSLVALVGPPTVVSPALSIIVESNDHN